MTAQPVISTACTCEAFEEPHIHIDECMVVPCTTLTQAVAAFNGQLEDGHKDFEAQSRPFSVEAKVDDE